ncbi:hypothetical protein Tco_1011338, partial [Tanacetum coccineum]
DHLKKDCPKRNKKKSTGFVKKNVGQGSGSEGYDNGDLLMAVNEERFLKWYQEPRLRFKKSDYLEYKHGGSKQVGFKQLGSKQVGFKQLGSGVETGVHGVHDEKCVWFEVELQGAQGDHEAEVFQVSNDDTAVAQRRLEDKQPEEKTNMDCLVKEQEKEYQTGWKIKTCNVLDSCNQRSTQQFWSVQGTGSMQVLQGDEFEVEPQDGHTFEGATLSMGTIQYREDSNEAAFAVAAVACEVISKWKAGLKDYMDARSDVYVLSNGYKKCSDDSDDYYLESTPCLLVKAKGNILDLEIIRDQSGNTLRVSQSRIHNEKLVQTLLKGHFTLSLEDSL